MKKYLNIKKKDQKGFTLLEYCAGAAIMIGIVVGGMNIMGGGLEAYFTSLRTWIADQGESIDDLANGSNPVPANP